MKKILFMGLVLVGSAACTDLEETLIEDLTKEQAQAITDPSGLLSAAYADIHEPFIDQAQHWAASQHTSDETIGPTRAGDWDDNGVWRVLHTHQWPADHQFLTATFNNLLKIVFSTTNVLSFNPNAQQEAEAKFLRAFAMLAVADGWNQVPFREPGGNLLDAPDVLSGVDALNLLISDVEGSIANLPDGPATRANKNAARTLLMKAYFAKGVFANRTAPTFAAADMDRIIALADEITATGAYSLADNYFDNFAPDNSSKSTENIFTFNHGGADLPGNDVSSRWNCTLHYNQNPSGWNGFSTLGAFYDSFEEDDTRRGMEYAGLTDVSGIRAGLLFGQQVNQDGVELQDRKGNPLSFTKEIKLRETGDNLEVTGIRVIKYPVDYEFPAGPSRNDYVFYRYADVLLMKAEALLRKGEAGDALDIVNEIREKRGASELSSLDAATLLAERGRELYWEGHRRTDMIRFGTFLDAAAEKPATDANKLLFPIPLEALAVNPNLTQNPGYTQ